MFPSKLFFIDPNTGLIIGSTAALGTIYGPSRVFEHFGDDVFGLRISWRNGHVERFDIKEQVRRNNRITFILESTHTPGQKMVILSQEDEDASQLSGQNRQAA
jgi:hypothetical protein